MNEEVVVILDASFSMGDEIQSHSVDQPIESEDFLGTTKLDVARYIVQQLFFRAATPSGPLQDQTKVLALITLGEGPALVGKKRKRPSEGSRNHDDTTGTNGCCCYFSNETNVESAMDEFHAVLRSLGAAKTSGDFVNGIHCATAAMLRSTTVGAARRRIVLVTDARHKVLEDQSNGKDPMEALAETITSLSEIGCRLEVVGMGFSKGASADQTKNSSSNVEVNSEDEQDGGSCDESSEEEDDDDDDDWSDVMDQNELLLLDLVEKLGGCVLALNGGTSFDDTYGIETALKQLVFSSQNLPTRNQMQQSPGPEPPSELDIPRNEEDFVHHCEKDAVPAANCSYPREEIVSL